MRYLTLILATFFLAAATALGVSALDSPVAEAAGGGSVKKCGGGKIFLNAEEKQTFALHNKIRRNHKLRTFCVHPKLEKAARAHSKDMIRRDYFSHNTKGRGSFAKRLKRFGYTPKGYKYYTAGENIAYGSGSKGSPNSIMEAWMKSPGHRRNILNGKFREIGIGTYTGTYKSYKDVTMYTADFGTRR
ncbi:MAG: CAP domain-containing protein [Rubrobacteraceae bacterium]